MPPWPRFLDRRPPLTPDTHICQVSLSTLTDAILILESLADLLDPDPDTPGHPQPTTPHHHRRKPPHPSPTAAYIRATVAALATGNHHPHLTHSRAQHHRAWTEELSTLIDHPANHS